MTENIQSFTVEAEQDGTRLDRWLADNSDLTRSRIQALIASGDVSKDNQPATNGARKVREGEVYALRVPPPVDDNPEPEDIPLSVVFEDEHLIVVNKVSGMTVHPAPGSRSGTLVNALLFHCGDTLSGIGGVLRPGIVHRIDKDTSGLLVVAKSDKAHFHLSRQFAKHSVGRTFICFVRGEPKPRDGRIESRLARSPHDRKKQAVVKGTIGDMEASDHGRHAVTHDRLREGFGQQPKASLGSPLISEVECQLETGRTHQIRVHMAHIGCPLLGDPLYGRQRAFKTSNSEAETQLRTALSGFKRQALHAKTLGFIHPVSKEEMQFDSELPDDIQKLKSIFSEL